MSTTYTTLADFIDQEIVPAITGVEDDFDVQGFTRALGLGADRVRHLPRCRPA